MNPDQHTLFKLQKWHLARATKFRRHLNRLSVLDPEEGGEYFKATRARLRRQLGVHQRFVDCITPFVRQPTPQ